MTKAPFLSGIVPPIVTPLTVEGDLDVSGLEKVLEHVITGAVHGLFILGTTGEGPALAYANRRLMVEHSCRITAGRLPILVGITDTSFHESLELSHVAKNAGASAVVMAPPYYFPFTQEELIDHYLLLADKSPLPVFVYNMPGLVKVSIAISSLQKLIRHTNIVGFKDSSGDLGYLHEARQVALDRSDFSLFIGPEHLLSQAMSFGIHGGVNGGAQLFPKLFVALYDACRSQDVTKITIFQKQLEQLQPIYRIGPNPADIVRSIKGGLAILGLCGNTMTTPLRPWSGKPLQILVDTLSTVASSLQSVPQE